jgi:hypothetical protein
VNGFNNLENENPSNVPMTVEARFKAIKLFVEVCAMGGKRFLKWVLKFPN